VVTRHVRDLRVVDRFGLVACPRRGRDVPVRTCLTCRQLLEVRRDEDDRIVELRCRAAGDGRVPDQQPHPFGLLGPIGPWRM
jgi:hypothetical protein